VPLKETAGQKINHHVMDALKAEATRQGMSFEQIAREAGLDRSTVSRSLRKERNPSLWSAADMAKALGVSLSALVKRAEEEI